MLFWLCAERWRPAVTLESPKSPLQGPYGAAALTPAQAAWAAAADPTAAGASTSAAGWAAGRTGRSPGDEPVAAAPRVPLHWRLMRRTEQAVTLFSLMLQLTLYSRSALLLSLQQHLHQLALLSLRAAALWAATCLPHAAWLRLRVLIITFLRVAIAAVPSQRTADEGDAVLLDHPASPGALGAARDFLRLLTGEGGGGVGRGAAAAAAFPGCTLDDLALTCPFNPVPRRLQARACCRGPSLGRHCSSRAWRWPCSKPY